MKASPYLTIGATLWCIEKGVVIVGYDFYHGNDEPTRRACSTIRGR